MRLLPVTSAIAIALLSSGCFLPTGPELHFTRKKPSETELIGSWRPTAETLKDIHDRGLYPTRDHELILRSDHTFTMRNMPDWWRNGFGESHGQFESGDGQWELAPGHDGWQIWIVQLHFSDFSGGAAFYTLLHLYYQRAPYLIFVGVGDPDEGRGMLFERSKT
jgi:hypothetical protein